MRNREVIPLWALRGALLFLPILLALQDGSERRALAQSITAPRPKQEFDIRLPLFEEVVLPNGLTIYSYQDDSLPLLAVGLAVRAGSAAEPAHKGGLADLAYSLLAERADSEPLSGDLTVADLGARLSTNLTTDGAVLRFHVMAAQGERAVAALAMLAQLPPVDPAALSRLKSQLLLGHGAAQGWPRIIAEEHMLRLLYGPQHPYGHAFSGTAETIGAITAQDIASYYACSFFPKNAALIVAGRATAAQVREWATRHFGAWQPTGQPCEGPVPQAAATPRTQVIAIAKPGMTQSLLMLGRIMVPLGHKDEVALSLANSHLAARTSYKLRTKAAITYGVSWDLKQGPHGGHFLLSTLVQANKTDEALSEILSQMFSVQREPVPARLVIGVRLSQAWRLVSTYNSLGSGALHIGQGFMLRQPLSRDQLFLERLKQVGPNQVDEAGYHYFDRSMMQIVVVGDPEIIRKQVAPLKLGTLRWGQSDGSLTENP